jgi:hypothetical protein
VTGSDMTDRLLIATLAGSAGLQLLALAIIRAMG